LDYAVEHMTRKDVLKWDPKSLEIRTRTVEKALEPLVIQVSISQNFEEGKFQNWIDYLVFV